MMLADVLKKPEPVQRLELGAVSNVPPRLPTTRHLLWRDRSYLWMFEAVCLMSPQSGV